MNPRINLALVRYANLITNDMTEIAHDYNILALLISHSGAIGDEFYGEKDKPAFVERTLKNVYGAAKMYIKVIRERDETERGEIH